MSADSKQEMWPLIRPVLQKYLGPERRTVALGVVAGMVAAAAAGFGLPFMVQYVFPVVFGKVPPPAWLQEHLLWWVPAGEMESATLWGAAMLIPLVMSVRGLATYLNSYLLTRAGMRILSHLRTDLFARLQWLSFSFHDRHQRGDLMTTVIQYTQTVQQQMVTILNDLVIQPLTLVAAAAYLVYTAVTSQAGAMLLGNLLISALCIPVVRLVGRMMVKRMKSALAGMNVITATVEETFSAQREVRAFNLEKRQEELLRHWIRCFNSLILRVAGWQQALAPSVEIVSALALSYALYQGCGSGLTLEQFTAIATAFYFCYDPLKRLGTVMNQAQVMAIIIQGLNEILLAEDETPEPTAPASLPEPVAGVVDFDHVSFGYTPDVPVLHDISLHVSPGEIVALVGPSGSGKTTFINLICRFYDPNAGSVRLDGVDVRELTREQRTRSIGLVSQFSALFRGTVRENIRVGRPGATDEEVHQAGDRACVTEFTETMPEGYDRAISEGGSGLSGGQRQRVSIARAFLKNAPILILDEATSALDMKSEAMIQEALERLVQGHTTFIIAHRFSTIRMARRILVFEEGRIIADGTHSQLYEQCMLYRHLYDEQVGEARERKEASVC